MTNFSPIILSIAPAQAMLVKIWGRCYPRRERIFRNQVSQRTLAVIKLNWAFLQ